MRNVNETLDLSKVMVNPPEETVTKDRDKYLGGSDIAKITNKRTLYNMFQEKLKNRSFTNEYTELGHIMEDNTKAFLRKHIKEDIKSACYVDNEKSVRANVDGLMIYDDNNVEVIEMKNNNISTSFSNIEHYIKQTHLYMYMLNTDKTRLFETERLKDDNGKYITTVDESMITCSTIPRNDDIIDNILNYINDFKFLLSNPDISYNDFIKNDLELVKDYQRVLDDFIPRYRKYKELKYEKDQITSKIKELVSDNSVFDNGDIKISYRVSKPKLDALKIYKDFKQDYINYIILDYKPEYNTTKTFEVEYNKVSYDEFNNVDDLLYRLDIVNEELDLIKKDVEDDEKAYKLELANLFPLGVDFNGLKFTVNNVKKTMDYDDFLRYVEDKHNVHIDRDSYMTSESVLTVYKITPKIRN